MDNALGEFLRARRDRVTPQDAGLHAVGPRRVPGLRRDELAGLAGVSEAYYTRLERGRDRHPSAQVVDALARALRLDADAHRHLRALAGTPAPAAPDPGPVVAVPPGVAMVVDGWPGPATAADLTGLVLAANPLARGLSPAHAPGTNAYRSLFLDPAMRDLYAYDYDRVADEVVAGLRAAPDGERVRELTAELRDASPDFARRWARYEVRPRAGTGLTRLDHPDVGPLTLRFEKLAATDHPNIGIVLFSAGPDPADAAALERLRVSLARPARARARCAR